MKIIYDLKKDSWREDFFYAYGPQAKAEKTFTERDEKGRLFAGYDKAIEGYDYISAITKKKYPASITASAKCSFEGTGAPLIVFSDDLDRSGSSPEYVLHFEVVAYSGGCNVWRVIPKKDRPEWPVASTKIYAEKFEINDGDEVDISVRIDGKILYITMNGKEFSVSDPEIPDSFHIGFTACEGVCRFSEFSLNY